MNDHDGALFGRRQQLRYVTRAGAEAARRPNGGHDSQVVFLDPGVCLLDHVFTQRLNCIRTLAVQDLFFIRLNWRRSISNPALNIR
jgi:hypothetical protein